MEWIILIMPVIIELIQGCQENRSVSDVQESALNRPFGRIMIRRALRKEGLRGSKLREAFQQVLDYKMSDDDVKDFVSDALS